MSSSDNRFVRDPDLARLHDELVQLPTVDDTEASDNDDVGAEILATALEASMFSPTVQRYVGELLLGGENPSPAARQRLVSAAGRGLRNRRALRSALPALLAFTRKQREIPVPDLAEDLGVSEEQVYGMESGRINVRTLGAELLAAWIRAVRVDSVAASDALRQALLRSTPSRSPQAAARGRTKQLSEEDQRLIDDVTSRLQISND
jgi:transcriptional regulator with XRE-family HTH domain